MNIRYTHYTNFGCSVSPRCADAEGFIAYRENFEKLPELAWAPGEAWIHEQTVRVAQPPDAIA
jgi:hypothetical protein